jgi:hypothetical protein
MTARVDSSRRLVVRYDSEDVYGIDRFGNFYTQYGAALTGCPPVGVYYQLRDIVEFLPGNSAIRVFAEEMEWSRNEWRIRRIRERESEFEFGERLR